MKILGNDEDDKKLIFSKCPVCGEELFAGRMEVATNRLFTSIPVRWYNDEKLKMIPENPINLPSPERKLNTNFKGGFRSPIPAGYCKNCNKLFAAFDVKDTLYNF